MFKGRLGAADTRTTEELIFLLREPNPPVQKLAFDNLYQRKYRRYLRAALAYAKNNEADAQDSVQQASAKILAKIEAGQPLKKTGADRTFSKEEAFDAFMLTTIKNSLKDIYKKRGKRKPRTDLPDVTVAPIRRPVQEPTAADIEIGPRGPYLPDAEGPEIAAEDIEVQSFPSRKRELFNQALYALPVIERDVLMTLLYGGRQRVVAGQFVQEKITAAAAAKKLGLTKSQFEQAKIRAEQHVDEYISSGGRVPWAAAAPEEYGLDGNKAGLGFLGINEGNVFPVVVLGGIIALVAMNFIQSRRS